MGAKPLMRRRRLGGRQGTLPLPGQCRKGQQHCIYLVFFFSLLKILESGDMGVEWVRRQGNWAWVTRLFSTLPGSLVLCTHNINPAWTYFSLFYIRCLCSCLVRIGHAGLRDCSMRPRWLFNLGGLLYATYVRARRGEACLQQVALNSNAATPPIWGFPSSSFEPVPGPFFSAQAALTHRCVCHPLPSPHPTPPTQRRQVLRLPGLLRRARGGVGSAPVRDREEGPGGRRSAWTG